MQQQLTPEQTLERVKLERTLEEINRQVKEVVRKIEADLVVIFTRAGHHG